MTLTEIGTTETVTASPETAVSDILDQMDEESVGSVLITDDDHLVGIVTDRKIAMACRDTESLSSVTAEEIMTTDPITISDDDTHVQALEKMSKEGIRRIPIASDGDLVGIVTLDDLIMATGDELQTAASVIEKQTGQTS